MDLLEQVEDWYSSQCDGDWEHQHGISIDTLDNPGWSVTIDLKGTNLSGVVMSPHHRHASDSDWVSCEVRDAKFIGNGGSRNLGTILELFTKLLP